MADRKRRDAAPTGPGAGLPAGPLDRRQLLAWLGASTGAAVLAACGGDDGSTASTNQATTGSTTGSTTGTSTVTSTVTTTAAPATTVAPATTAAAATTVAPLPPVAYDPNTLLWVQGNYAGVPDEITAVDLEVEGTLPPELTGLYARNGSNPKEPGQHWFMGDGMVHGVRLDRGKATWYGNRWVQTAVLGRDLMSLGGAPGGANNTSNTSILNHRGTVLSLQEVGHPYELSPSDLSTIGPWDAHGTMPVGCTAHPKIDPATGKMHCFVYGFTEPYLTYYVIGTDGRVEHSTPVPVPGGTMIHDFAITDRDVVFWDLPVVFSIDSAVQHPERLPFAWQPSYGARLWVMPLGGTGDQARSVDIPLCYVFHGTNAWREGDDVVVDVSWMPDALVDGETPGPSGNDLRRWRVGTARPALTFTQDVVVDRAFDLPTIDLAQRGRPHDVAYYVHTVDVPGGFHFGGIASVDRRTAAVDEWVPSDAESAGEPLVVDGWVLVFVYDRRRDSSDLAVFAADDLAAGPVARVRLPRRVPYGFHAAWFPG